MSGQASGSGGDKKRPLDEGNGRKKGGIRWDEQNLEENERIKKELNPRKIDEPKTPYLSPMDTDEEGDLGNRMRPLALDDPAAAAAAAAAVQAAADAAGPSANGGTSDEAGTSGNSSGRARGRHVRIGGRGWSDSDRTVSPSPRHPEGASPGRVGRSPRFSEQYYEEDHDEEEAEEGEADPQRQEKRRRFKEARKQHYNMREQLARARELLEDSEDSEDPAAVERQQQAERQREQGGQGRQALNGGLGLAGGGDSEGHLDADVESEQEGGRAAAPQRGGGLGGVTGEAAASERPGPGAPGGALSDA